MENKRKLVLIVGPSESGKSTLQKNLVNNYSDNYDELISATTRSMRSGEINKKDYYFLSVDEFSNTRLIESAKFGDNFYGTPYSEFFKNKKDIVHVIEPYGASDLINNEELKKEFSIKLIFMDISQETIEKVRKSKKDDNRSNRDLKDNIKERFQERNLEADLVITDLFDEQYQKVHSWINDEKR